MLLNFKQFFVEIFGSFSYHVPIDKEKMIYDFYMLQLLRGRSALGTKLDTLRGLGQDIPSKDTTYFEPNKEYFKNLEDREKQVDYMLEEITDILLPQMKQEFLNVLVYCVSSEFKHLLDSNDPDILELMLAKNNSLPQFKKLLKVLLKNSDKNYHAVMKYFGNNIDEFMNLAKFLFENAEWNEKYGGKLWINIVNAYFMLKNANAKSKLFIAIDHVLDLEHNSGMLFDKVEKYAKNGSYDWLKNVVNYKAIIKSPKELLDKVSPQMKNLSLRAIQMKL